MPIHTVAYAKNASHASLTALTPLARSAGEDQFRVGGDNDYLMTGHPLRLLFGACVGGPTIARARITAPSLVGQPWPGGGPDVFPVNVGAEPLSPLPFVDLRNNPLPFEERDGVQVQTVNAAAEDNWAFLWFADSVPSPDYAGWRPFRFVTTASALTAEQWTSRTLTPTQTLRQGAYECGGLMAIGSTLRAARLSFVGQTWKPGAIVGDALADVRHPFMDPGALGVLGSFREDSLPSVEFMADAADNEVQEVFLWLRKTA